MQSSLKFNKNGLVLAICQDYKSGEILMVAWMNRESFLLSVEKKQAVFYSRSREKLWHKGEESGFYLHIKEMRIDCDGDSLLLIVEQVGGISCHTGRRSCFYRTLKNNKWHEILPVLKDPNKIYKNND
jgi:phosphoribosyl-AMP cyclohydrolase